MVEFQWELTAAFPSVAQSAYLDDLTAVAPVASEGNFDALVDWLFTRGPAYGHHINNKSLLYAPDGLEGIFPRTLARLDCAQADGLSRLLGLPFSPVGNVASPFSPVGDDDAEEAEAAALLRAVAQREPMLRKIAELPDGLCAWLLVRFCTSAWCRHTARLVAPPASGPALSAFDAAIARCVCDIAGQCGRGIPPFVERRLLQPGAQGGAGVGSATIAPAAFAGSTAS